MAAASAAAAALDVDLSRNEANCMLSVASLLLPPLMLLLLLLLLPLLSLERRTFCLRFRVWMFSFFMVMGRST